MHAPTLTSLIVILVIVILIFGTKKLRNMGGDLGSAIRNFRSSMKEGENAAKPDERAANPLASNPPESDKPGDKPTV